MAYSLSNKCAKNHCKRTVLVQLIIKNVVTCFLEHSVGPNIYAWAPAGVGNRDTCSPFGKCERPRFASVTTFWSAKKEPKCHQTRLWVQNYV